MSESAPSPAPEPTPFERMQRLALQALSVPKTEIDRRESEWRQARDAKRAKKK